MKLTLIRALFILFFIFPAIRAFAQNTSRLEEEQKLEAERKAKVEAAILSREAEAREIEEHPEIYANPEKKNLVEVEPNNILPADLTNVSALIPYRIRRQNSGVDVGVGFSTYAPINYESSYISGTITDFKGLFGSADTPMIELYLNYKKNFSFGSLGLDLGVGYYKNSATTDAGDNLTITLQIARFGVKYILDSIGYEPKIAPYVGVGGYTAFYKDDNGVSSVNGNTEVAPYYMAGIMAQLNWIDPGAAVEAYAESGIENTFLYGEVRQYQASANDKDPDLSTDPVFDVGMSLEF